MTVTPIFGIHVPDGRTKLKDLGTELSQTANDLEAALVAASIPPVTPAAVMVAASAAARDQYWGVPGTAAARTTLQNRGATTIRTDKGWTEQYFAQWHATQNPGGASVPGWYPITGAVPFARMVKTNAGQALTAAGVLLDGMQIVESAGGFTIASNRLTVPIAGMYKVTLKPYLSSGAAGTAAVGVATGTSTSPNPDAGPVGIYYKGAADESNASFSADVYLAANSTLGISGQLGEGSVTLWGNGTTRGTYLEARYIGPRQA